jgi:phosphomannomutase/phosphoglucomutase
MLKPTIFREYEVRGIADLELLDPDIELLGQAIGRICSERPAKS